MKGYLYILKCANGEFYTGSTNNLELRLSQHHAGEGSNFTWKHLSITLVYTEEYDTIEKAFKREKQLQKWSHKKKMALIQGDIERLKELSRSHSDIRKQKKLNKKKI